MKNILLAVSFAAIFSLGVSEDSSISEVSKKFKEAVDNCAKIEEPPLSLETLTAAKKGGTLSKTYGSGLRCIYKATGILNGKFEVDNNVLQAYLKDVVDDADKIEEAIGMCSKKKDTPEETSVDLFNCVSKHLNL